jgi:hypothetical protein
MTSSVSSKKHGKKKLAFSLIVILLAQVIIVLSQSEYVYAQTVQWQRTLNHKGSYTPGQPEQNATDFGFGVAAGSDGVYIVGRSHFDYSYYYEDSADTFMAKYDFAGNLVFDYRMPVPWFSGQSEYDGANKVIVDGKNVFITGLIGSSNPNYGTSYLIVFNESTSEYTNPITWGGGEYDWEGIDSITKYNGELFVVISYEHLRRSPPLNFITDWWNELRIIKFSSNLTKIWEKNLAFAPHTNNEGNIAVDSSGIYLAGEFERPFGTQSGSGNYSLVKLDFNGNFLWKSKYKSETDRYTEISEVALRDGYLYITGVTGLNPTPNPGSYNWDFFIAKYDTSGNLEWDKVFATKPQSSVLGPYYPVHIALGTNGIYLSEGITKSITGGGNDDVSIVKLDFNGNSLWQEVDWGGLKNDYIEGMTAVGDDAYLTGFTQSYADGSGFYDAFLLKYGGPTVSVVFSQSGVSSDFGDTVVTIDSVNYKVTDLPKTFTWNKDSSHTFSYASPLDTGSGKKYIWTGTSGLSTLQSDTLIITASGSVTANYQTKDQLIKVSTQNLIETIKTWNLPKGIEKSLISQLQNALQLFEIGRQKASISTLNAFIKQAQAQSNKGLTSEQANMLISEAQKIINLIKT